MSKIGTLQNDNASFPEEDMGDWGAGNFGGRSDVKTPPNDFTIKQDGPPCHMIRAEWLGKAPITSRLLPNWNRDEHRQARADGVEPSVLDHGRNSSSQGWSDWLRYDVPGCSYVGLDERITTITYDPRRKNYVPKTDNPYHLLWSGVADAAKAEAAFVGGRDVLTPKWANLASKENRDASITPPCRFTFFQALVYEYSNKPRGKSHEAMLPCAEGPPFGAGENDLPVIIQGKNTAGSAVTKKLNETGWDDPVSLTDGPFVSFVPPSLADYFEDFDLALGSDGKPKMGWGAHLSDTFVYTHRRKTYEIGNDISEYESKIKENILIWDRVLHFPSHEELCLILVRSMASVPDIFRWSWKDHPEFFTDDVEGILGRRTVVSVPTDFDDEDDDEDTGSSPKTYRKVKSSTIPETEDIAEEELEEDVMPSLEEDEELDDDLFGVDEDEEEEEESAADETAHRRSRLRVAKKKATPRRRQ